MMYVQRTDVHGKLRRPGKKTRKKKGVVVVTYLNLSADKLFARDSSIRQFSERIRKDDSQIANQAGQKASGVPREQLKSWRVT